MKIINVTKIDEEKRPEVLIVIQKGFWFWKRKIKYLGKPMASQSRWYWFHESGEHITSSDEHRLDNAATFYLSTRKLDGLL